MGKNLVQQGRGKGGPRYRAPSFKYKGEAKHVQSGPDLVGKVVDLFRCSGHTSPLAKINYGKDNVVLLQAPEGMRVGDEVRAGNKVGVKNGNIMPLKSIPEGTIIYNIESQPGDGGKFVRASGGFAKIVSKRDNKVVVQLPSSKTKLFLEDCRAAVGVISGGGRKEKPFLKAGRRHHAMKSRNKLYPHVSGTSMNAVDHPFGGTKSSNKGRPTQSSRNSPPGRKVGKIAPKKTGKRKR